MKKGIIITIGIISGIALLGAWFLLRDDIYVAENDREKDAHTLEERIERAMDSTVKIVRAVIVYETPAGEDEIGFVLGVNATGVIVSAGIEEMTEHEVSKMRQESFRMAFPDAVVGKKLLDLSDVVETIGGSPLTTEAFNGSLPALKSQLQ